VEEMTYTERFIQITEVYPTIFINEKEFSSKLGYQSSSTVNSWMNGTTKNIQAKNRSKICEIFGLQPNIWKRDVVTGAFVTKNIKDLEIITKEVLYEKLDSILLYKNSKEQGMLEDKCIDKESPESLFLEAVTLKKENKIEEGLKLLEDIYQHPSNYKYTHYNEIEHFKAILLSHDTIKEWDEAINILKRLYSSAKYHLVEPEIITLIASNYKRKALYREDNTFLEKDKVDMDLIVNAITVYKEAYNIKDSQAKYYDAINFAYLHNIVDAIEVEYADPITITQLYTDLTTGKEKWRLDDENWWEVISNAEFLMLLGRVDEANQKINYFFDFNLDKVTQFDINVILRQLELYIHFTRDENAIAFRKNLSESWNALNKKE